jgi:hypothetical protein
MRVFVMTKASGDRPVGCCDAGMGRAVAFLPGIREFTLEERGADAYWIRQRGGKNFTGPSARGQHRAAECSARNLSDCAGPAYANIPSLREIRQAFVLRTARIGA